MRQVHYNDRLKEKVTLCVEASGNTAPHPSACAVLYMLVPDWEKEKKEVFANKSSRKGFDGSNKG